MGRKDQIVPDSRRMEESRDTGLHGDGATNNGPNATRLAALAKARRVAAENREAKRRRLNEAQEKVKIYGDDLESYGQTLDGVADGLLGTHERVEQLAAEVDELKRQYRTRTRESRHKEQHNESNTDSSTMSAFARYLIGIVVSGVSYGLLQYIKGSNSLPSVATTDTSGGTGVDVVHIGTERSSQEPQSDFSDSFDLSVDK